MSETVSKTIVRENGSKEQSVRKEWTDNGITKAIEVRKVKGGYIIRKSKWGKPKDEPDAEWTDETSEEVSTKNPFEEKEAGDDKMFGFVDTPIIE